MHTSYVLGDTIQVNTAGEYCLTANLSFSGTNGEAFKVAFIRSGGTVVGYPSMIYTANTNTVAVSIQAYASFTAGQKFVLGIINTTDTDDPVVKSGTVSALYLHD